MLRKYNKGDLLYYKHPLDKFTVFGKIQEVNLVCYTIKWSLGSVTINPIEEIDRDINITLASATQRVLYDELGDL